MKTAGATVGEWVNHWAKHKPNKAAIIYEGTLITYGHLAAGIEASRDFIEKKGAWAAGKTAVICVQSPIRSWSLMIAARAVGLNTICLPKVNHGVISGIADLAFIAASEPEVDTIRLLGEAGYSDQVLVAPEAIYEPGALERIRKLRAPQSLVGGHTILSSASTGQVKKILIPASDEDLCAIVFAKRRGVKPTSKLHLMSYAPSSSAGYKFVIASFKTGATVIFDESINFASNFYSQDFNLAIMRPSHIDKLYSLAATRPAVRRPNLRIHFAGGFINFKKIEWIINNITEQVFNDYGASECCGGFALTKVAKPEDQLWHAIYPDCGLELIDDCDQITPDGVQGAVRVKLQEPDARAYLDDPEASQIAFRNGYFYPGDMAVRRPDGRIRLLGRVSDVLIVGSEKHPVGPIQENIEQHLGCMNASVFARQSIDTKEEIFVALEMPNPPSDDQAKWLRQYFSMVDSVHILAMPGFPKTAAGKVDRRALRDLLFAGSDAPAPSHEDLATRSWPRGLSHEV